MSVIISETVGERGELYIGRVDISTLDALRLNYLEEVARANGMRGTVSAQGTSYYGHGKNGPKAIKIEMPYGETRGRVILDNLDSVVFDEVKKRTGAREWD